MTREEFFKRLPENIRQQAEEAIKYCGQLSLEETLSEEVTTSDAVLGDAFLWSDTNQGPKYWANVSFLYFNSFE